MTLAVQTDRLRAEYGDFSHVFGRGMLPSVFEDEELNFDTRLEGLAAHYTHDLGSLSAIGGSNRGNRFRGVYVEPARWKGVRTGGGFVEAWGAPVDTQILAREQHAGGYADVTAGPASLYGEYVHREFSDTGTSGRGAFGAAILSVAGPTSRGRARCSAGRHPPTCARACSEPSTRSAARWRPLVEGCSRGWRRRRRRAR